VLRLWAAQARIDALVVLRGPRVALSWYAADLLIAVAGVSGTFLLAARFDGIGGWSRDEVLFMLGFAMASRGLVEVCCGWNVAFVSRKIGRGQLDHTLIQPLPLATALLLEGFAPITGSPPLVAGLGLLGYATVGLALAPGPLWLTLLALNLLAAAVILLAFAYAWGSLAFLAPRGAEEINSQTTALIGQLRVFPLDGVPAALRAGLLSVVPAGLAAWLPSAALLGKRSALDGAWITPLCAVGFAALAVWIFRRGLSHYGRTGSVRYVDHGFRR
jgi:ABC-2 type transport system permease protein